MISSSSSSRSLSPSLDQKVSLTVTDCLGNSLKRKTTPQNNLEHIIVSTGKDTVLQFIYSPHYLIVIFFQTFLQAMFLFNTKSASAWRDVKKEGRPGFTALICLRSGIWSDCMFVFHYASTTNPFCWKSSLLPCVAPCVTHGSWIL